MNKITVERADFARCIAVAGSMAGRNKTLPILDCIKCSVKGESISMTSFDGEVAVTRKMAVTESSSDFVFCINARDIQSCIKLIASPNIVMSFNEEMTSCTVIHNDGEFTFAVLPADDFPAFTKDSDTISLNIASDIFTQWVKDSQKFVSTDELRPVTMGMYLYSKNGNIGYCATDSRRLITEEVTCEGDYEDTEAIIPSNAFRAILDVCADGNSVNIKVGKTNVMFIAGHTAVLCRKMEGKFPNFRAVIPAADGCSAEFVTADMLMSVTRASSVADSKSDVLKLTISENMVTIQSDNLLCGKKSIDKCSCESDGSISLGLSGRYFADALSCISSEKARMYFKEANRAVLIKESEESRKYIIVMPVALAN